MQTDILGKPAAQLPRVLRQFDELPGPRGIPVLGNALQIEVSRFHLQLEQWCREYGPFFKLQLGKRKILVVLNQLGLIGVLRGIVIKSGLIVMALAVGGCAQDVPRKEPEPQPVASKESCQVEESSQLRTNTIRMGDLFGFAVFKLKGMPCIGVWARNLHGAGQSVCGMSPPHFVLGAVQESSPAANAGFQEGDVVVSLNGAPVRYHLDYEVAVMANQPGASIRLVVRRGDRVIEAPVPVGLERWDRTCN